MRRRAVLLLGCIATLALMLNACQPATGTAPEPSEPQAETAVEDTPVSPTENAAADMPDLETPLATPTNSPTAATTTTPPDGEVNSGIAGDDAAKAVQVAREDLSRRNESNSDEVEVVSVTETEWPNAALGCPLPDTDYAQQVTRGYVVVLADEGQRYTYHTDNGARAVLCGEDGEPVLPEFPVDLKDIDDGQPWLPVD